MKLMQYKKELLVINMSDSMQHRLLYINYYYTHHCRKVLKEPFPPWIFEFNSNDSVSEVAIKIWCGD